jgi:hypothetical protein
MKLPPSLPLRVFEVVNELIAEPQLLVTRKDRRSDPAVVSFRCWLCGLLESRQTPGLPCTAAS